MWQKSVWQKSVWKIDKSCKLNITNQIKR